MSAKSRAAADRLKSPPPTGPPFSGQHPCGAPVGGSPVHGADCSGCASKAPEASRYELAFATLREFLRLPKGEYDRMTPDDFRSLDAAYLVLREGPA